MYICHGQKSHPAQLSCGNPSYMLLERKLHRLFHFPFPLCVFLIGDFRSPGADRAFLPHLPVRWCLHPRLIIVWFFPLPPGFFVRLPDRRFLIGGLLHAVPPFRLTEAVFCIPICPRNHQPYFIPFHPCHKIPPSPRTALRMYFCLPVFSGGFRPAGFPSRQAAPCLTLLPPPSGSPG